MKRKFTLSSVFLSGLFLFSNLCFAHGYPSGAPAGYTGSPGDGQDCHDCHGGSASTVAGMITSNIPSQGYTAGNSYTIMVTVTGTSSQRKGFEVSPQNPSGTLLGTLTAGSGNKLVGSGKYVTHTSGSYSTNATWSFTWTAPATGTGQVTFYGGFCVQKSITRLSTLDVQEFMPFTATATAYPQQICLNDSSYLQATATGGSGTYTYSWTSVPPGFTSNLQNVYVKPVQTTKYVVLVNDGSNTATDTTEVIVTLPPSVFAGNDTIYCITITQIPLSGLASNFSTVMWTTSGTGTFNNPGNSVTTYAPSSADKTNGSVILTLTAEPLTPCLNLASDPRQITFDPCNGIPIPANHFFSMNLTPNPSSGLTVLSLSGMQDMNIAVSVYDLCGKMVFNQSCINTTDRFTVPLDLQNLHKGVYFVKVQAGNILKTEKLIIE